MFHVILEALRNLIAKPFTKKYPEEKVVIPAKFRGRLMFIPKKCIGCRLCELNCPSEVVKFFKKGRISFDIKNCIFCGVCQDVCPSRAIVFSSEFEHATEDKRKLLRLLH